MLIANISTVTVSECARRTHTSHAALIACDGRLKYRTYKLEAAHLCFERFFSACAFVNALRHTPTLDGCLYTRCHHLALRPRLPDVARARIWTRRVHDGICAAKWISRRVSSPLFVPVCALPSLPSASCTHAAPQLRAAFDASGRLRSGLGPKP